MIPVQGRGLVCANLHSYRFQIASRSSERQGVRRSMVFHELEWEHRERFLGNIWTYMRLYIVVCPDSAVQRREAML